jgi:hypothetical protein
MSPETIIAKLFQLSTDADGITKTVPMSGLLENFHEGATAFTGSRLFGGDVTTPVARLDSTPYKETT